MPATGVYIVACLDMKFSSAYVELRKVIVILQSPASIRPTKQILLFRSTFSAIDLKLSLSWHCSSRDLANSSMAPGEGGLLLLFQGNTHRA